MAYSGWQIDVLLLFKQFQAIFRPKTPRCRELDHFSEMKNDALMHRESLVRGGNAILMYYQIMCVSKL